MSNINTYDQFSEPEEKSLISFDFNKFLKKALRNWYYLLIFSLLGLVVAFLYNRYTYPVYQISARILTQPTEEQELSNTFFAQSKLAEMQSKMVDETQILQARNLVANVLEELNLGVSYYSVGRIKDLDIYPYETGSPIIIETNQLSAQAYGQPFFVTIEGSELTVDWNGEEYRQKFNRPIDGPFGSFVIRKNPRDQGGLTYVKCVFNEPNYLISFFQQRYNVRKASGSTSVLDMTLQHPNGEIGKDFLEAVIDRYDRSVIENKNRLSAKTEDFLEKRIIELEQELADSEDELMQFLLSNELFINSLEQKSAFIRTAFEELNSREMEVELVKNRLSQLRGLVRASEQATSLTGEQYYYDLSSNPLEVELITRDFSPLIGRFIELLVQQKHTRSSVADNYPGLLPLRQELDSIRTYLVVNIEDEIDNLEDVNKEIRQTRDSLYNVLVSSTELRIPSQKITRLLNVKEQLYFSILQQREQIKLNQATAVSRTILLMSPRVAGMISRSISEVYMLAGGVGMAIPLLIMALMVLMDQSVDNPNEVKKKTNVPVIASIGHSRSKQQIVVTKESRTGMAEMFRLLRSNLNFFTNTKSNTGGVNDKQALLVTSSVSGDGKTFVVVNMGMSMAIAGKKVCLVNIDLRKPKLARYLGREDTLEGLSTYLAGGIELESIIQESEGNENLHFIPSGPIPPNPAELLLTERMRIAAETLKEKYDVVIFDAPPIGAVADAFAMEPYVDVSLFIVRYRHSQLQALELIQNVKDEKKLPSPAIVLNDAKVHQNSYSYGYGYGYGYGYYADDSKGRVRLSKWWKKLKA
ncbi:MAG: polysaccharide biosynthesis tyrosine autokinase [Cyclobacteriaceae bacterium]